MDLCYFRAGVATVIYRNDRRIAWFRRKAHPEGVWQFQQGGIDPGETPEETLWRELYEETGVSKDDIADVIEYPHWLSYTYPLEIRQKSGLENRLGQTHRWYFLKLRKDRMIDISRAPHEEFDAVRWVTFDEAIEETGSFKHPVYKALHSYFETALVPEL